MPAKRSPSGKHPSTPVARQGQALPRVKLRHLSVLLEVARAGSAKDAAAALCVTESAISKTLKELEEELDLRLFERSKQGMRLTDAGTRFIGHAANALAALQVGVASARDVNGDGAAALRFGAMPVVAAILLPAVMKRLMADSPGLIVEVVTGSKVTLLQSLRKGHIELVLGRLPPAADMTGLSFEQLFVDRYIFVARPAHPLVARSSVTAKDLGDFVLVMPTRETVTWHEIQRFFVANGVPLNTDRIETIALQLSRNYTLSSDAVWAASARLVRSDIESGSLVELRIATPMLEAPLGLITKPDSVGSFQLRQALGFMRDIAAKLPSKP